MSVAARFHKYCKHHGIDVDKKLPYGAITSFMTDHIVWTAKILRGLGPRLGSSGSYRVDCDNSTDLLTQGPRRKGTTLTQAADVQRHGAIVDCCGCAIVAPPIQLRLSLTLRCGRRRITEIALRRISP